MPKLEPGIHENISLYCQSSRPWPCIQVFQPNTALANSTWDSERQNALLKIAMLYSRKPQRNF